MPFAASAAGAQVCLELKAAGLGAARLSHRMAQDERIGGGCRPSVGRSARQPSGTPGAAA